MTPRDKSDRKPLLRNGSGDVKLEDSEHSSDLEDPTKDVPDDEKEKRANHVTKGQKFLQLMWGVGGIYGAFIYYGSLQEDVFRFQNAEGVFFTQAWFLQFLEAAANVILGYIGLKWTSTEKDKENSSKLPKKLFFWSGFSQVSSKAFNSLALAYGLSFPVATLAKSAKMAPVMAGSLFLGGAKYTWVDYFQVTAIIAGTFLVNAGSKKKPGQTDDFLGVVFILLSLALGGVTGGLQKRLQKEMAEINVFCKPYDFMYWTNLYMCGTAFVFAMCLGEVASGTIYCLANPEILSKILQFSACSALGQSFVFYTLAHFDPLICATVTTSRKLFSVLFSVLFKGNPIDPIGWLGLTVSGGGILLEPIRQCAKAAMQPRPKGVSKAIEDEDVQLVDTPTSKKVKPSPSSI